MVAQSFTAGEEYEVSKAFNITCALMFFCVLLSIGWFFCLTGIGIIIGLPMIGFGLYNLVKAIFVTQINVKGPCPHCGEELDTEVNEKRVKCGTCKKFSILRDGNFYEL